MEQRTPRTGAAMPWLLLLCLAAGVVLQAYAQPDIKGFISVDCGAETAYVYNITGLLYATDAGFTDAGSNYNISVEYINPSIASTWYTLRSFPTGARNCYTLRSLQSGLKYLVRAKFQYGNYDGLRSQPIFDLHIGVNFWKTMNISNPDRGYVAEAIVIVPDEFLQVCLVNTGTGTPFISGLDLRPLKNTLYPQVNATHGLVLLGTRANFGPTNETAAIRYPDDPHDRIWWPWVDTADWDNISTPLGVQYDDLFEVPTTVMQTAVVPQNASKNLEFHFDAESQPNNPVPGYIIIMHFAELQLLPNNAIRQYYINLNGKLWWPTALTPSYLSVDSIYNNKLSQYNQYNFSITATSNSSRPPIINAMEVFSIISTTNVGTDTQDASAMMMIKDKYRVQKNWMGDPCVPKNLAWDGLTCKYAISKPPIVTRINLSFSGLNDDISSSFANLKAVKYLNLSNNNLVGSIPDELSQLPSLTLLDLSNNNLNGPIPAGLVKRIQDGSLNLRYENNPNLCLNGNSCRPTKRNNKILIYIVVSVVVIVVIVSGALLFFHLLRKRKQGLINDLVKPAKEITSCMPGDYEENSIRLENRQFTYNELGMITNNFQRVLGRGGFGYVYHGYLEDGTQVAVKLRSHSSSQGVKEFIAEAQILTRIHHKNLVSLIGYCKDGEYMALVCEYMPEGTLQEHIAGKGPKGRCLTWRQRLRIALESGQGLEYLHKGCNPPIIHRDVKATNILLNARLEAKIADFGVSKAFSWDNDKDALTNTLVGTPGYVDPEYVNLVLSSKNLSKHFSSKRGSPGFTIRCTLSKLHALRYQATMQPSTKSDVYGFGVVLLELVTGKPAILCDPEPINVIQWARQRLAQGDIEAVVDTRMSGDHDVNGVWKATNIALKCTEQASAQRPTMTDVLVQLQECLELEEGRIAIDTSDGFHAGSSRGGVDSNLGYNAFATDQSTYMSQSSATSDHSYKRGLTMEDVGPAA